MDRRDFIKKGSAFTLSGTLLSDPFIRFLADKLGVEPEEYIKQFDHHCDYLRPEDLLSLRFYFVGREWKGRKLVCNEKAGNGFMIVRIPQQHVIETYITVDELHADDLNNNIQDAFISGYSYLTFKFKDDKAIEYSAEELLNWRNFDLHTLHDLNNYVKPGPKSGYSPSGYPNQLLSENKDAPYFFKPYSTSPFKIPTTIFELPYKLFLSPVDPTKRILGKEGDEKVGYNFGPNDYVHYYTKYDRKKKTFSYISRPWENELNYVLSRESGDLMFTPNFKAVGHLPDEQKYFQPGENELKILPNGGQRAEIVDHTLYNMRIDSRDIQSKNFKVGALGATTFLRYKNAKALDVSSFVGWDHDVKNGRDNYAKVTYIGIDIRSGKKVLVSEIGQRHIHKEKSVWVKRLYLQFIEQTKDYQNKDFPFKRSRILKKGYYIKTLPIPKQNPNVGTITVSAELPRVNVNGKLIPLPFIAATEDTDAGVAITSDNCRLLKPEFEKTSQQNEKHRLNSHVVVIFKSQYDDKSKKDYYNSYRTILQNRSVLDLLRENMKMQKLSFIDANATEGVQNKADNRKNTTLKTSHLQFASRMYDDFESEMPVSLHLDYAMVVPPQIEGYTSIDPTHFRYTPNFIEYAESKGEEEALKRTVESMQESSEKSADYTESLELRSAELIAASDRVKSAEKQYNVNKVFFEKVTDAIEEDLTSDVKEEIEGLFSTDHLQDIGGMIKPDINIGGISELEQGITMKADTVIQSVGKIEKLRPKDILRGLNAEVFNGVSLKDLLQEFIPIDQSPVFKVVEKVGEGMMLIDDLKRDYRRFENDVKSLPTLIQGQIKELSKLKKSQIERYFEKRYELEKKQLEVTMDEALEKASSEVLNSPYVKRLERLATDTSLTSLTGADFEAKLEQLIRTKSKEIVESAVHQAYQIQAQEVINRYNEYLEKDLTEEASLAAKQLEKHLYHHSRNIRAQVKERAEKEIRTLEQQVDETILKIVDDYNENLLRVNQVKHFITYTEQLKKDYEHLKSYNEMEIKALIKDEGNKLTDYFKAECLSAYNLVMSAAVPVDNKLDKFLSLYLNKKAELEKELDNFNRRVDVHKRQLNNTRKRLEEQIKESKKELETAKNALVNFVQDRLKKYGDDLIDANKDLVDAYNEGEEAVKKAKKEIRRLETIIRKIKESNRKTFKYEWGVEAEQFTNIKSSFVSFYKKPNTSLAVNVRTDINYKLSFDEPPKLLGTDVHSFNQLTNFRLAFFDVLAIDFDNVTFETGTKVDTDFDVSISNVEFSGALNFVNVFQSFMDSLNFLKSILNGRIVVDYSFTLPDITAGAFNFMNGKLVTGVILPIGSDEPMSVLFGVNKPDDLFLVSYGIFGGRGCFQIEMDTKRGVTMVLLVIEFGGVVLLNVGVARGFAYLFAGIYYKKKKKTVVIQGYLVAGGSLSIAGLITASITFTMKLVGNGNYLEGRCSVHYTVKLGPFFEKSFKMTMKKKIAGAKTESSQRGKDQRRSEFAREFSSLGISAVESEKFANSELTSYAPKKQKPEQEMSTKDWKNYIESFMIIS